MSEPTTATIWAITPDGTDRVTNVNLDRFDAFGLLRVAYDDGTNVLLTHSLGGKYNAIASNKASFNHPGPDNVKVFGTAFLVPSAAWKRALG
jgi:hypothetical protein